MIRKVALAAVMMFGIGSVAKADIVIDTFTDSSVINYQISGNAPPFSPNPLTLPTESLANGWTRSTTIEVVSPLPAQFNAVSGSIGGGTFSVDTNNSSKVFATLSYNLLSTDFSSGSGIRLDFVNLNPGNTATDVALDMPISVEIGTATGTLTSSISVAGSGAPFPVFLSFASFTGSGDLSQVNTLGITLNSGGAGGRIASDFVIDNVVVPTNAVPAPPAILLALAAAPLLAFRRWSTVKVLA